MKRIPYTADALLAHPRFADARMVHMKGTDLLHGDHPTLNRLLNTFGRVTLFKIVLGLDAVYRPDQPSTWPTVGRIQKEMQPFGLSSPRSIDEVLAVMRHIGMVEITVAPNDRRSRLVRPTDRMLAEERHWLAAYFAPLAELFPDCEDYALALAHDRTFQEAHRYASGLSHDVALTVTGHVEPILYFLQREMGSKVLHQYLQAGGLNPGAPIALSYDAVARRTGTSRTHVRNIMRDAAQMGFVEIRGQGGQMVLQPKLLESVDRFMAESWACLDRSCIMALEMMRENAMEQPAAA